MNERSERITPTELSESQFDTVTKETDEMNEVVNGDSVYDEKKISDTLWQINTKQFNMIVSNKFKEELDKAFDEKLKMYINRII